MKKMLVLCTFVALLAISAIPANAAATLYDFTFRNTSGGAYCDGLFVYLYSGGSLQPKTLVDGYHWNTFCAGTTANVNGFKAGVSSYYQYAATGATLIIADPDSGNGAGGGEGYVYLVNTTYHTWTLWGSGGGAGEFVANYGTWVNFTAPIQKGTKSTQQR